MYRYVGGRQTYYPSFRLAGLAAGERVPGDRNGRKPADIELSEEQQRKLQLFLERFDTAGGLEIALRLVAAEVNTFSAFQACKVLHRLAKRFREALQDEGASGDARLMRLLSRCTSCMVSADSVSLSRALWSAGKLRIRDEALLKAAAERIPEVLRGSGPITVATIWHSFEVFQFEAEECLNFMALQAIEEVGQYEPPEISIILHAAAQLRFRKREELFSALVRCARDNGDTFSERHMAVCVHAAAKIGLRDEALCENVASRFLRVFSSVDALAITSAVYAFGLIGYVHRPFLEAVAKMLHREISAHGGKRLETQQIANIIYAFGKLAFIEESTFRATAECVCQNFHRFKAQEVDNITYGFALVKYRNEAYLSRLCTHLLEEGRVDSLEIQSLVSLTYSFALLEFQHQQTLRVIGDRCIPKLHDFKAEECSIIVYSLGVLNFRHHDLLREMVEIVPRLLPNFSTQNISNLLHGLGLVGYDRSDDFICHVADHLSTRLPECSGQDIANPLTALMRLCIPHPTLMQRIADMVTAPGTRLPIAHFTPQEIANVVYAFDGLQYFHHDFFAMVQDETAKRLEDFIPQEIANVCWALSKKAFSHPTWFEGVLARCAPYAEGASGFANNSKRISQTWCGEDLEKPLAALRPWKDELPSYQRIEAVFRHRFLGPITNFLRALAPRDNIPAPPRYQKDFAAWDLYQVGPSFTEEVLGAVGVQRVASNPAIEEQLLEHYVGSCSEALYERFGEKLLISVLPAARWLSCHMQYRLQLLPGADEAAHTQLDPLEGSLIVEAAHPKDDDVDNQRRFKSECWFEPANINVGTVNGCGAPYRPVLLSTFLGNWRHRHTELVALDALIALSLEAVQSGKWPWTADFWRRLSGEVRIFVPHTPCLSCVGACAQLKHWSPNLRIQVAYDDWRVWRSRMRVAKGCEA